MYDFCKDLEGDIDALDTKRIKDTKTRCLAVKTTVFEIEASALIDTGSQVTCVSEEFWKGLSTIYKIDELPVVNMYVVTAIGKKATRISRQILIDIKIGNIVCQSTFLVIPHLTEQIIFGHDWLLKNKGILDYNALRVSIKGMVVPNNLVSFHCESSGRIVTVETNNAIYIYILNLQSISEQSYNDDCDIHAQMSKKLLNFESDESIMNDHNKGEITIKNTNENINIDPIMIKGIETRSSRRDNHVQMAKKSWFSNDDELPMNIREMGQLGERNDKTQENCKEKSGDNERASNVNKNDNEGNSVIEMINIPKGRIGNKMEERDMLKNNAKYKADICKGKMPKDDNIERVTINQNFSVYENENFDFDEIDEEKNLCELREIGVDERRGTIHDDFQEVARKLKGLKLEQTEQVKKLLQKYEKLFMDKPGGTTIYTHRLRVIPHKPFVSRSYPIPLVVRKSVRQEIEEMLRAGIIERSESQYCNPLHVVKKKDGRVRLCLDARALNNIIESDNETPPKINELVQKFHGVEIMTSVDLTHGYWQIPLAPESRPYTAFLFDTTLYQFCRVPFGVKTAGNGFIRALNMALGHEFDDFLTCYIDDLLISSKSFDEHLKHLAMIFDRLLKHNFTLNIQKSLLCRTSVQFLGFIISREGVIPDPSKVEKITKFEPPKTKRQLQQFLGMCNYYRQFCVKYANYVEPFRGLLQKNVVWNWTDCHAKAFQELKGSFVNCVALSHFIPGAMYQLQTDGSDNGISGVLFQTDACNNSYIISLVSRCLTNAEKRYTTTEKELLAIVYSVMKFRTYLLGVKFRIITDHKSLTFLNTAQFHSLRLQRWILLLQQYDFEVVYCKGKDNVVADFFSRHPESKFLEENPEKLLLASLGSRITLSDIPNNERIPDAINALKNEIDYRKELKGLPVLQREDERIKEIFNKMKDGSLDKYYTVYEDILFRRGNARGNWQIVVPKKLCEKIIESEHHRIGHAGVYKTLKHIQNFYFWHSMAVEIKKYVVNCDLCQRTKPLNIAMAGQFHRVESNRPRELVAIDFYGPLPRSTGGVQYILVAIDVFSKYVCLYPLRNATTQSALKKMLDNYVPRMGKPDKILSDNGTQFSSSKWRIALEKEDIAVCFSSVRHPQSNPAERVMRELGRHFRTMCHDRHTRWARCITTIEKLLNTTVHSSTGYAPCELHFGQKATDEIQKIIKFPPGDPLPHNIIVTRAHENILKNFKKRREKQKTVSQVEIKEGDFVLLRVPRLSNALDKVTRKFFHLYEGPYRVTKVVAPNAYQLSDIKNEKIMGTYNRSNLRKYKYPDCKSPTESNVPIPKNLK